MHSPLARAVAYSFFILLGLLSALPNVLPDSVLQKLPSRYAANTITLGLDLRGGSHLLLEVDTDNLVQGIWRTSSSAKCAKPVFSTAAPR